MASTDDWARGLRAVFGSGRGSVPVNKGSRGASRRLPQIDNPVLIGVAGLGALGAGLALRSLRPTHRAGRSERIRMLVSDAVQQGVEIHGPEAEPASVDVQVHEAFGKPPLVSIDVRMERAPDQEAAQDLLDRAARAAWDNPELAPVAVRARVLLVGQGGSAGPDRENVVPADAGAGAGAGAGADGDGDVRAGEDTTRRVERDGDALPGADSGSVSDTRADNAEISRARRNRLVLPVRRDRDPSAKVLVDMTSLGCEDETARPADLYARYGSPASDPNWRP